MRNDEEFPVSLENQPNQTMMADRRFAVRRARGHPAEGVKKWLIILF